METAKEIQCQDDVVDELFGKTKDDMVTLLLQSTEQIGQCIDLLMAAKYLERIGDHAVNLSLYTPYSETVWLLQHCLSAAVGLNHAVIICQNHHICIISGYQFSLPVIHA